MQLLRYRAIYIPPPPSLAAAIDEGRIEEKVKKEKDQGDQGVESKGKEGVEEEEVEKEGGKGGKAKKGRNVFLDFYDLSFQAKAIRDLEKMMDKSANDDDGDADVVDVESFF